MLLILFMLLCSCSAIQSADIKERGDEKKHLTAQLALLKDMFKAPDGYEYIITAKVHDTQYLLVYGKSNELKIKEVNDKGVFEVPLTDYSTGSCDNIFAKTGTVQLKDSCGLLKSKKKFIYYTDMQAQRTYAFLTDEKWMIQDTWEKKCKIPKKDSLKLFDDQAMVTKSETID